MMGVMQMLLLPLSFLSGALYPLSGLPGWLTTLTLLNPVTYSVHAIRTTVFNHLDAPQSSLDQLNPPLEWFGWSVPISVQIGVVVAFGLGLLVFAIHRFDKAERALARKGGAFPSGSSKPASGRHRRMRADRPDKPDRSANRGLRQEPLPPEPPASAGGRAVASR